jgi:hypothetical protein
MEPENNPPQPIIAYCRACGKGLNLESVTNYQGTAYCAEHVPQMAPSAATVPPPPLSSSSSTSGPVRPDAPSPGLAFVLGLIPGVGAIYNAQYAKGFVHVLVTGLLFSLSGRDSGIMEPMFETFSVVWFFYMAFEAYHTAKKKMLGEPVDEFSSLFGKPGVGTGFPVLPILLIVLGVLFLLNNLDILRIRQLMPYAGPVLLIALGFYMLLGRLRNNSRPAEASHERN